MRLVEWACVTVVLVSNASKPTAVAGNRSDNGAAGSLCGLPQRRVRRDVMLLQEAVLQRWCALSIGLRCGRYPSPAFSKAEGMQNYVPHHLHTLLDLAAVIHAFKEDEEKDQMMAALHWAY